MTWPTRHFGALYLVLSTLGCASAPTTPEGPTLEDKIARLIKLEDERSLGDGEVDARLEDPAGRVRGRAALVLGRAGDISAAPRLVRLLDDGSAYVRSEAAFALGLLEGELPPEAIRRLTEALDDDDEDVRARAFEALGKNGGEKAAEVIATALLRLIPKGAEPYRWAEDMEASLLHYPHHDLRAGILALGRRESVRWAWAILATEGHTPRFIWWPAAWAAASVRGDEIAPLLRYYAGSRDPEFRYWGARGFRSLKAGISADDVRLLAADPNERVRIEAVRVAAAQGLNELVPDLLSLLDKDTRYVQAEVLKALGKLRAKAAIETLIDRLGSESRWIRALALPALFRQDPDGFWLLLAGIGADEDWQVRASLAELLGHVEAERATTLLGAMVKSDDARVRAPALTALARRDPEASVQVLVQHLGADDSFERLAAARALAELGATEGVAPVEQAFLREDGKEPWVKAALLETLAKLDGGEAEALAPEALDDTNYLVRRRSAAILRRAGVENVRFRPRPSNEALGSYEPFVSPRYSPQAFIRTSRGGTIELELFALDAPLTVRNFIRLARRGFYNGLSFTRVLPNGLVQTGDPRGDGNGGPGYAIRSELNRRPIVRGSVAMADHGRDTAGSQFFITHLPQPDLDGRYTVFAQVTSGMEIVDRIEPGDTIETVTIWDGVTSPYREP